MLQIREMSGNLMSPRAQVDSLLFHVYTNIAATHQNRLEWVEIGRNRYPEKLKIHQGKITQGKIR